MCPVVWAIYLSKLSWWEINAERDNNVRLHEIHYTQQQYENLRAG